MMTLAILGSLKPVTAVFAVTGSGDSDYDGSYYQAGTYNSQPYFTNGSCFIFFNSFNEWYMNSGLGLPSPIYKKNGTTTSHISGVWTLNSPHSPAPTVAEV